MRCQYWPCWCWCSCTEKRLFMPARKFKNQSKFIGFDVTACKELLFKSRNTRQANYLRTLACSEDCLTIYNSSFLCSSPPCKFYWCPKISRYLSVSFWLRTHCSTCRSWFLTICKNRNRTPMQTLFQVRYHIGYCHWPRLLSVHYALQFPELRPLTLSF